MDKYLIPTYKSTLEVLEEPEIKVKPEFVLGIVGHSAAATKESMAESMLSIAADMNLLPNSVLLPTEGNTSIFIQIWAERNKIPCTPIEADWSRMGRKARALRDSRIVKEATHLLFFLGKRSDYYEKMAIRELKKGKIVYTIDATEGALTQWIAE